jgi:serine/threonine protein kinase
MQAWLAMERVRGVDLSRYTQRHLLLPENLVLRIGARVGAALAHAHAQGVVHRDLKPANVLVNLAAGQVKLVDFGVARQEDAALTRTGMTLGTPAYMAPEQLTGAPASPATDTYALGVMLFELLAGRRPHQAATLGDLLQATAQQPPAALSRLRPDLPATVVAAVEQLLAREPADRPANLETWAASVAGLAALMTRLLAPSASTGL